MKSVLLLPLLGLAILGAPGKGAGHQAQAIFQGAASSDSQIRDAFAKQGIRLTTAEAASIRANVLLAVQEAQAHGLGNSKVDFAAVEIAQELGLDIGAGSSTVRNVVGAIGSLVHRIPPPRPIPPVPPVAWETYFADTVNTWNQPGFLALLHGRSFSPVKISWEDIGRHQNSVWGDRISDVGIWVRRNENDPGSAQLALSVRRDNNFRDKVLMVPSDRIKIHVKEGGRTLERTLPERLRELGLSSQARDRNVIVSNQFAIVPVPSWSMEGAWSRGGRKRATPPRAAFNFSIFPYGSTNFVITDVIEGSSEAIVGPGTHQMLYANIHGQKAPFTASRAEDRQDLRRLEKELKAKGMDVDVQRYYLIQIPLRRDAKAQLSNLGTPPMAWAFGYPAPGTAAGVVGGVASDMVSLAPPSPSPSQAPKPTPMEYKGDQKFKAEPGLSKVAIGHGETEGHYSTGANWRGARAEEPIRVTVVYFVTPVGKITEKDMQQFAKAFSAWDSQAIWGGSFVTKETN
ncbi:MAG: hypothetical protein IPQ13_03920 [Holophagaceae bacterium]|nr:hypothetical protein [Holophagaceae bacterium]